MDGCVDEWMDGIIILPFKTHTKTVAWLIFPIFLQLGLQYPCDFFSLVHGTVLKKVFTLYNAINFIWSNNF